MPRLCASPLLISAFIVAAPPRDTLPRFAARVNRCTIHARSPMTRHRAEGDFSVRSPAPCARHFNTLQPGATAPILYRAARGELALSSQAILREA
jgi:hypothetical protein